MAATGAREYPVLLVAPGAMVAPVVCSWATEAMAVPVVRRRPLWARVVLVVPVATRGCWGGALAVTVVRVVRAAALAWAATAVPEAMRARYRPSVPAARADKAVPVVTAALGVQVVVAAWSSVPVEPVVMAGTAWLVWPEAPAPQLAIRELTGLRAVTAALVATAVPVAGLWASVARAVPAVWVGAAVPVAAAYPVRTPRCLVRTVGAAGTAVRAGPVERAA